MGTATGTWRERSREVFAAALDALTTPRQFFAARPEPSLTAAAAVVVLVGLAHATPALAVHARFAHLLSPAELLARSVVVTLFVVAFAAASWLAVAGLLYVLTYPVARRGGGRALLAYVGWGLLPSGLLALVVFGTYVAAVSQLGAPGVELTVEQFLTRLREAPVVALASPAGTARVVVSGSTADVNLVVGVTATLWKGYVWTAGVERARGLGRAGAALATAVPVAAFLLFHLA